MIKAAMHDGIIDKDEKDILKKANEARTNVIGVDDFTFEFKRK